MGNLDISSAELCGIVGHVKTIIRSWWGDDTVLEADLTISTHACVLYTPKCSHIYPLVCGEFNHL